VGGRIATAAGRKVRLWSSDGAPLVETEPLESTVSGLSFRGDGTALAAIGYGAVNIWPFVPGAKPKRFEWKGSLISLAWSDIPEDCASLSAHRMLGRGRKAPPLGPELSPVSRPQPKAATNDRCRSVCGLGENG
jgi:hypothetical protein